MKLLSRIRSCDAGLGRPSLADVIRGIARRAAGRRSRPNARPVIFTPGAACRLLYSLRSTSRAMRRTVASSARSPSIARSGVNDVLDRLTFLHVHLDDAIKYGVWG